MVPSGRAIQTNSCHFGSDGLPDRHLSLITKRSVNAMRGNLSGFQRALLVLLLFVSLAANPVGAFVHAWEHLHEQSGDPGKSLHHGGHVCELCAAYAAIGHAVPASGFFVAPALLDRPAEAVLSGGILLPRAFSAYHQRAPPPLLRVA
jgi:hypothetical protein